ncbi:MAG: glycosyltransferase family 4 protein [Terriglobales bacterium]
MMRIVLISQIFAPGMGYLENVLPKYLARRGAEVHVLASSLAPDYRQRALPPRRQDGDGGAEIETIDGFRLHVLGHSATFGHVRLLGLAPKLRELRPEIVQTMTPIGWIALEAAWNQWRLGYRLFSGCHYHASVFPLAREKSTISKIERWRSYPERWLPGRMASWMTEKYYAIAPDCAEVAKRFFGVPGEKLEICPLGVDTEIFFPASSPAMQRERSALRGRLGFQDDDIVCVYSGRFGVDKNPLLLARAISRLASAGEPFRGLFIGRGPQAGEIADCCGCVVQPFVPMRELGAFYRAAEIGVWPTQESMSMLDALACGLPLIANDTMQAPERLRGTGLPYRLGDGDDLVVQLRALGDTRLREKLGAEGARRMRQEFSWEAIARSRLRDYSAALARRNPELRNLDRRNYDLGNFDLGNLDLGNFEPTKTLANKSAAVEFVSGDPERFRPRQDREE